MDMKEIQNNILKWISDNYMATDAIRQNVCDDLGSTISDESFTSALFGLYSTSLVTSHIYDSQNKAYAAIISPDEYSLDALYWRAAEKC